MNTIPMSEADVIKVDGTTSTGKTCMGHAEMMVAREHASLPGE